jgi:hypothetical protein
MDFFAVEALVSDPESTTEYTVAGKSSTAKRMPPLLWRSDDSRRVAADHLLRLAMNSSAGEQ